MVRVDDLVLGLLLPLEARAFALLGPFEPWQTPALGYNALGTEIGAPKNLGGEYRWNVPVITYGVDRAFIDFFGDAGVEAVKSAFGVLNELPPASEADPMSYLTDSRAINVRAQATNLVDLKSAVLSLALEQLGLASPERYVWTLRNRRIVPVAITLPAPAYQTNYLVINRNFDPVSYDPSIYVNAVRYAYSVVEFSDPFSYADAFESIVAADQASHAFSSAAGFATYSGDLSIVPGVILTALTQDDVGGLFYLLHAGNRNFEPLPDGIRLSDSGTNSNALVRDALRPGVDKLRFEFIAEAWDTIPGWRHSISWTDTYYIGEEARRQDVTLDQSRPDIVISAADLGTKANSVLPIAYTRSTPNWKRATNSPAAGPGILQGPCVITLAKLGLSYVNVFPGGTSEAGGVVYPLQPLRWGSFDQSAKPIIVFPKPVLARLPALTVALLERNRVTVSLADGGGLPFRVEMTSDFREWTSVGTLSTTNSYRAELTNSAGAVFFRAIRE